MAPSDEERRRIFGRTKGHCAYCGERIAFDDDWDRAHLVSRAMLEKLRLESLAEKLPILLPAHPDCNRSDHKTLLGAGKALEWFLSGTRAEIAYDRETHGYVQTYPERFYGKRKPTH